MNIDRSVLPIVYRKQTKKTAAFLIGIHIANVTFSETSKTYFVNFREISDDVVELNNMEEVEKEIENAVVKFLEDCLNINQ